jgi:hypothetical protein
MSPSSFVSPDQESATTTSSAVIMPRSPWLASLGWTKKAGVPVEARVAAIFVPICPDLPIPVTITRPLAARMRWTVSQKASPRPFDSAEDRASRPARSVAIVRRAESMAGTFASSLRAAWSVALMEIPRAIESAQFLAQTWLRQ